MAEFEPAVIALSTPPGTSGIAVLRMSGEECLEILRKAWRGKDPQEFRSHTVHLGWIADESGEDIDQVVATVFRAPNSYTGEDVVEISCHGSMWVVSAIVRRLIECGAEAARAGEFTRRAFINGRLDLAQADGVADMIAASSRMAAKLAAAQMKGTYSKRLEELRKELLDLCVLLELELDFSEEDVEFADRQKLITLAKTVLAEVERLSASFKTGQAFKNGVPVAITGIPNVGKSTLLNALVGDQKAIVTDIPGTTRDAIEDAIELSGILFRFVDTAGLRESADEVEKIGIQRTKDAAAKASIILYLIDPTQDIESQEKELEALRNASEAEVVRVLTKADISLVPEDEKKSYESKSNELKPISLEGDRNAIVISAKEGNGLEELKKRIVEIATGGANTEDGLIITNARHYNALCEAEEPLQRLIEGLQLGLPADILAQDLRQAERSLAEITGAVTSDELLSTIFSRYCIGK